MLPLLEALLELGYGCVIDDHTEHLAGALEVAEELPHLLHLLALGEGEGGGGVGSGIVAEDSLYLVGDMERELQLLALLVGGDNVDKGDDNGRTLFTLYLGKDL